MFFAFLHVFTTAYFSDDFEFKNTLQNTDLLTFIITYYRTWSSRIILDAVFIYLISLPQIVWQIIDVLLLLLLYYDMYLICSDRDKDCNANVLLLLMCCYPFKHMGSSGWICTTINYLWPLSLGLYMISSLFRIQRNKKIKWYQNILYTLAMIFASGSELMAVVLLVCLLVAVIYYEVNKIPYSRAYIAINSLIGIAGVVIIMTCPGNSFRLEKGIVDFMPNFRQLTFRNKIRLNYIAVFEHFVSQPDVLLFLLCFVVFAGVMVTATCTMRKLIAGIPLLLDILFTGYYFICQKQGLKIDDYTTPLITCTTRGQEIEQFILLIGFSMMIISLLLAMYWIFEKSGKWKYFKVLLIVTLGVATRMALSMSPTMFASYTRVYIYIYFAFVMVIAMLIGAIKWEKTIWYRLFWIICMSGVLLNVMNVINMNAAMNNFHVGG